MLITPGAVDGLSALDSGYSTLYLETVSMSKVDESDLVERARNVIGVSGLAEVRSSEDTMQLARDAQRFESVKAAVYAGAVIVLLVAALSVLVLAVEQVRERRRALAAVSASGVGFGTLARSLLWQNTIPLATGAVLAVGGRIVLAHLVLRIPEVPIPFDWGAIVTVVGMASALVIFVTALSLPVLRAAVSVKNLRTE